MWPAIAAAAVPAIASAFGQERANRQNKQLSREAMAFEQTSARESMAFSERMSGSAWQRGVQDMRLAGINPMLAFSQGPASAPQGASAGGQAARMEDVIGPAVSSAQHGRRLAADMEAIHAGIARTRAEEDSVRQSIQESQARTRNLQIEGANAAFGLNSARARATRAQIFQEPLNLGLNLTRRLFDPQNARVMGYELSRAARGAGNVGRAAVGRAGDFLRGAVDRLREIGPDRTRRN